MAGSDRELLMALAAGAEAAFASLYDLYAARMFRAAWALVGSREEAEDVVQDVFVALVQAGRRLTAVQELRPYLFAAVRHAALRRRERLRKRAMQPIDQADEIADPTVRGKVEDRQRLDRALQELPHAQREAVAFKLDGELTFAEVGSILGISANTAASRYRYALEKLRTILGETTDAR